MNPAESAELDLLLNRLVDDTEPAVADVARLAELLRTSGAARARYRDFMALHAALSWDYAAAAREPAPAAMPARRVGFGRWAAAAGFAALLAGGASYLLWAERTEPIAFVEGVSGAVAWSEEPAARPHAIAAGAGLRSGTLTTEGENSTVQLRLSDGTRLSLDGETEIALTRADLKLVQLRRGAVGTQAPARPSEEPVVIRTTTGEVEIAAGGAELTVSADAAHTAVEVTAGQAQFQRLADGRRVALSAAHRATATLDARASFTALPLAALAPNHWRRTYEQAPAESNKGAWLAADAGQPARVRAVPCIVGRHPDGSPIVHYGITARADRAARATLDRGSTVTIRWRTAQPASLNVMLGLHLPGGSFGGNFELLARAAASPADAHGWRTTTLRVADFAPKAGRFATPSPGALVTLLLITTRETPADLEIAEIAIESPAA